MACSRFALYVGDNGRKVTQPLHHDGEPPKYYDCKDGTRLPLVMVQRYPVHPMHTVPADAIAEQDALYARMRARNVTLFGRKVAA